MKKIILALVMVLALPLFANENEITIAHGDPPTPLINGPRVLGATPGRWFQYLIPATGEAPLTYAAEGLPAGLTLDAAASVIRGTTPAEGEYQVTLIVSNKLGQARRKMKIIAGPGRLALTPPLGWNSWNAFGTLITDKKIRETADGMVRSGLAAHGFTYVNIDDGWERGHAVADIPGINIFGLHNFMPERDAGRDRSGRIQSNLRFPNMKKLADYIHGKGLKFGIYSTPGPWTCAGYEGSYKHEQQDAQTWADWGVDYLKYDYCSYGNLLPGATFKFKLDRQRGKINWMDPIPGSTLDDIIRPYREMGGYLKNVNRDIVFGICNGGPGDVWKWGKKVGGNLWRTGIDIQDNWANMSRTGFRQPEIAQYTGPGGWNDPDMLVVGRVGWGIPRDTRLTRPEQVTHITIWAMQAAPLLLGCDLTKLDQFTIDLMTNDDVLDVDQDPLGVAARVVEKNDDYEVWARPLWDGTVAVALFNKGDAPREIGVEFAAVAKTLPGISAIEKPGQPPFSADGKWMAVPGFSGPQPVRSLWLRSDLGDFTGSFKSTVAPHGAVMVKIGRPSE